ncbi:MAG: transposase [Coleofasciculaceae cyanobacterium]
MKFNPEKHHRRSIRLKGYDYTQPGAYFITICTYQRQYLFGEIIAGTMHLNLTGQIVQTCWKNLSKHFPFIELDAFTIMPNHLHGIIIIAETKPNLNTNVGEKHLRPNILNQSENNSANASPFTDKLPPKGTQPQSLGAIIQNFKSTSTRKNNRINKNSGKILWQRNYYEQIIRGDEQSLHHIQQYITDNSQNWREDKENLAWQDKQDEPTILLAPQPI